MYQDPNDLRQDDAHVRDAVRFGLGFAVAGVVFVVVAAVWVSTCDGATADIVACGAPQRTLLAIGAPVILLIGGLRAFFRDLSGMAQRRNLVGMAGGRLVPADADAARRDDEHARPGRAGGVRRITAMNGRKVLFPP